MRKYIIALLLLLSIFCYASCSTIDTNNTDIEYLIKQNKGNAYQKDFLYMITKLKEIHPSFTPNDYAYVYDDDFKKLAYNIYKELGKDSFKEETEQNTYKFCYIVTKLLSKIKDGHTYFSHINVLRPTNEPTIPIVMKWFENDLYIIDAMDNYEFLISKKVSKIGSINVEDIKSQLYDFISGDNYYFKEYFNGLILCRKGILELLDLTIDENKLEIEFISNNALKKTTLEIKKWKGYKNKIENFLKNNFGRKEIFFNNNNCDLWYQEIEKYNAMYIQINEFASINLIVRYEELFKILKEKNIRNIIIDLRSNNGGDIDLAERIAGEYFYTDKEKLTSFITLYKPSKEFFEAIEDNPNDHLEAIENGDLIYFDNGIVQYKKNNELMFNGKVYFFTSSLTYSAGTTFAGLIKDNKLGILIGEPTSNASTYFTGGGVFTINLPNTGLGLITSIVLFVRTNEKARLAEPDAVYPDIYIPTTFDDYINGKDPCWEYLIENVFNKQEN